MHDWAIHAVAVGQSGGGYDDRQCAQRGGDGKQVTANLHFEPFPILSFFLAGSHEPCLVRKDVVCCPAKEVEKIASCLCMNANADNWDDLRVFLAVARAGSLSGAARSLGVNHSTVFRRIGAFELALEVRLFDRLPGGYVLTAAGEEMRESALRVEAEIAALGRKVVGQDLRLSGTVRIATIDMLAVWLLPRHLAAFRAAY